MRGFGLILFAWLAVCSLGPARLVCEDARQLLEEGVAAAQAGQHDLALDLLSRSVSLRPSAPGLRWLGYLYRRQGLTDQALDSYAAALALSPADKEARSAVSELLQEGLPASMAAGTPAALTVPSVEMGIAISDPRLEAGRRGEYRALLIPGESLPAGAPQKDPWGRWSFSRAAWGYLRGPTEDRWQRRFQIHCNPDDRDLAERALRLLCCLQAVGRAYLDRQAPLIHVWLCPGGEAGAESWNRHLFVYRCSLERTPAEWVRELCHEYGHLVVPGGGGFAEPEGWANGAVGEVLFAKWLLANPAASQVGWLAGLTPTDYPATSAAANRRTVESFLKQGPASPLLREAGQEAFDCFLGAVVSLERALGPALLRDSFARARGQLAVDFLSGAAAAMAAQDELRVEAPAWVYLAPGRWSDGAGRVGPPEGGWRLISSPVTLSKRK